MATQQNGNKPEFYDRLREELEKTSDWPTEYLYKFIVPNDDEKVAKVIDKFDKNNTKISKNYSKTGKYVSLSFITRENNPDAVIEKYKSLADIEGLIAL